MKDGSWEVAIHLRNRRVLNLGEQDDSAAAKATALPVIVAVKLLCLRRRSHVT